MHVGAAALTIRARWRRTIRLGGSRACDADTVRFAAEHAPLRRDWRERAPLCDLYHLLNHVKLFGVAYVAALREALARSA